MCKVDGSDGPQEALNIDLWRGVEEIVDLPSLKCPTVLCIQVVNTEARGNPTKKMLQHIGPSLPIPTGQRQLQTRKTPKRFPKTKSKTALSHIYTQDLTLHLIFISQ